jgi:transcriptional regulator with XRE-family HTH domain
MILEKIKILCKTKNITISELERILGFGNGTIHRWDVNQPTIGKVLSVAKYFCVSTDYLLNTDEFLPSQESRNFSKIYDALTENQKDLVKCYISIIAQNKAV